MPILRGLLKAMLAILLVASTTLALLLLTVTEQQFRSAIPEHTSCPAPEGWSAHLVQVGENLTVLADIVGLEPAELVIANCLQGDLHPGDTIFLPPPSPVTDTCGPPEGWQLYEIQSGDTLSRLARRFSVSEEALWHANCISESMTFPPGFRLYVPPATETP
jgi:LysM repeat protein